MSKLYLVGMSGPKSLADLQALINPINQYFDGLIWVLHDGVGSNEEIYLESIKGAGKVIHLPFCRRHAFSRNHYLWCGPAEEGDWLCQIDTLEHLNVAFAAQLRDSTSALEKQNINTVYYYNKAFLYQQEESLEFSGSPHEGLRSNAGKMKPIELSHFYPTETDVRYSVRYLKRTDPKGWISHYVRYYIDYPYGSNHCLLGNCERGNEMEIFQKRESLRTEFRDEMRRRGIKLNIDALVEYWKANNLDETMKRYINNEKILNDTYRHFILNDPTTVDEHNWTSLKMIP